MEREAQRRQRVLQKDLDDLRERTLALTCGTLVAGLILGLLLGYLLFGTA